MDRDDVAIGDLAATAPAGNEAIAAARWFSDLTHELVGADGLHETLQRIVDIAAEVVGADLAVLVGLNRSSDRPEVLASTDYGAAEQLIAIQRTAGSAPAWQAFLDRATVQVSDLSNDVRWPEFASAAVQSTSIRSVVAFCLLVRDEPLGALALYSKKPVAFESEKIDLVAVFCEYAAVAFREAALVDLAAQLERALRSAREIGAAIGILMERLRIAQPDAFALLRKASQDQNRKLADVAATIVESGELPLSARRKIGI